MTLMPPSEVELPALANGDANAELTVDDEDFTALDVRSMGLITCISPNHESLTVDKIIRDFFRNYHKSPSNHMLWLSIRIASARRF